MPPSKKQTEVGVTRSGSIFEEESKAYHRALAELRTLMMHVGFVVEKKRTNEATLRVYVRERLTYPLLNPRFVRRKVTGVKGSAFLDITVLSKGHEALEQRLPRFHQLPFLAFRAVGEWQSAYFVHGHFLVPLTFQGSRSSHELNVDALEPALSELLKFFE